MKKYIKILYVLAIIILITGCNSAKKAITADEFKEKMLNHEYDVENLNEFYKEYNSYKNVYVASNDSKYDIYFIECLDIKTAKDLYNTNYYEIENNKGNGYFSELTINFSNYSLYSLDSNGNYGIVSRIDDTIIVSIADAKYKNDINNIMVDLGYLDEFDDIIIIFLFIYLIIISTIWIISIWKIFKKANIAGWKSLIPVYNLYLLAKISMGNGWYFLLMLIPIINCIFSIILLLRLAKSFGKSTRFGIGLIFLTLIFFIILAFDKSKYIGE